VAIVAVVTSLVTTPAKALPTRWNLVVIPVDFSDDPGYVPPGAETTIVEGLKSYFYQQSNYTFDQLHVTWVPQVMRLAHPRRDYHVCVCDTDLSVPGELCVNMWGETCLNMWNSEAGQPAQMAKDAGYIAWDSICVNEVSSFGCGFCSAGPAGPTGGAAASMTDSRGGAVVSSSPQSAEAVSR